jgi:uncharacterized surface protein with fasciclin (FAS1) repeats
MTMNPTTRRRAFATGIAGAMLVLFASGPAVAGADDTKAQFASVQTLISSRRDLRIFAGAVQGTAIWSEMGKAESITLFVPSDRSLGREGSAFLLDKVLIAPSNRERLHQVLSYHIYVGLRLVPEDVEDRELVSMRGACFLLSRAGSGARIGPEAVVTDYIPANNGGIYVIDRLLWKPWNGNNSC